MFMRLEFLKTAAMAAGLCLLATATQAAEPREITWDDLVPAEAQFDDPFTRLSEDQLYELTLVAQIRDRIDAGKEIDANTLETYHEYADSLKDQEVDIDGLLAMREEVTRQRIAKTFLANAQLDSQQVRMPGYLLPLEFNGNKVRISAGTLGRCLHPHPAAAAQPDRARHRSKRLRNGWRNVHPGLGQRPDENRTQRFQPEPGRWQLASPEHVHDRRLVGHALRVACRFDRPTFRESLGLALNR